MATPNFENILPVADPLAEGLVVGYNVNNEEAPKKEDEPTE